MPHRTALIVDPDPDIIDSVRELLPWREVRVESTADPHAAIECLEKGSYSGLILDLGLAAGDSLDVLRHMSDRRMDIPIVVVASQFPDEIRELPIAPAIKLVVARPVEPELLAAIILGLCGM
jgi:CheY-like chemotaxis protein